MVVVKQKLNLQVGRADLETFISFAIGARRTGGDDPYRTGGQVLRDEYGKSLFAALGPVVNACEHGVLVIKIIVQDGDEGSVERKVLLKRARALHLQSDSSDAVGEENVRPVGLVGLRGPLVADRGAVGLQRERARNLAGGACGRLDIGGSLGEPTPFGRRNIELFVAYGLPSEPNGELSFVLDKNARGGFFLFLRGERKRGAGQDPQGQSNADGFEIHGVSYPRGYFLSGERFLNDEMRLVSSRSNNAEAEKLSDDFGGLAGAVYALVGKLIGREALCVEGAEASLVAEKGPAGHGHTAGKQDFDGRIEPKNGNASGAQKLRTPGLRVGSATESQHGRLFESGGAARPD